MLFKRKGKSRFLHAALTNLYINFGESLMGLRFERIQSRSGKKFVFKGVDYALIAFEQA